MKSYFIDGIEHKFERVFYDTNEELHYSITCEVNNITKTYKMTKDDDNIWKFIDNTINPELEIKFNKIILLNEWEM